MNRLSIIRLASFCLTAAVLSCTAGCATSLFRPATDTQRPLDSVSISDDITTPADITDAIATRPTESDSESDTTAPPVPVVLTASFIGCGDNLTYYGNVRDAKSCALANGRAYNFAPTYSLVADRIAAADIAFINQETLMCGDGYDYSYYPYFNSPQELGFDLRDIGFDVINMANNHMLDKGADGLSATIDFWNGMDGVTLIGGYKNQADYDEIRIVEASGIRVAFLAYTFETNYLRLPASSPLIVPTPDEETVRAQVSRAKELADFVLVSVHWGVENSFTPDASQTEFSTLLAELCVDAVIGHHPHVIQPVEWIDRPDGGRMLCVYSLGNFVAEMAREYNMLGGMIAFDMVLTDGAPTIENVEFIPTVYYYDRSFYNNRVYYYADFTKELAESHGIVYYDRTITVDNITGYLKNTISEEFLSLRSAYEAEHPAVSEER